MEVFDARPAFTVKSSMPRLTCWGIGVEDTVVVEARVTRYRTTKCETRRWDWLTWRAGLTLQAVSLLHTYDKERDDSIDDDVDFRL